ncbi:unnamed protein product [Boreogadus saida]
MRGNMKAQGCSMAQNHPEKRVWIYIQTDSGIILISSWSFSLVQSTQPVHSAHEYHGHGTPVPHREHCVVEEYRGTPVPHREHCVVEEYRGTPVPHREHCVVEEYHGTPLPHREHCVVEEYHGAPVPHREPCAHRPLP